MLPKKMGISKIIRAVPLRALPEQTVLRWKPCACRLPGRRPGPQGHRLAPLTTGLEGQDLPGGHPGIVVSR